MTLTFSSGRLRFEDVVTFWTLISKLPEKVVAQPDGAGAEGVMMAVTAWAFAKVDAARANAAASVYFILVDEDNIIFTAVMRLDNND